MAAPLSPSAHFQIADTTHANRLMMLPFENHLKNKDPAIGEAALDTFQAALINASQKPFRVIDRKQIKSMLAELAFSESALSDPSKALKMGQMLSANYMLSGAIAAGKIHTSEVTDVEPTEFTWVSVTVNTTLTHVETGEVLFSAKTTAESKRYPDWKGETYTSILIEATEKAVTQLAQKLIQAQNKGNG
ncbi:MAG: CsgG/HfaB family protein [Candidatus Sericytochromatia bacterium]